MALTLVGAVSAAASSVTPTNGATGDLLFVFAYRSGSNTAPSLPAGWTNVDNTGGGGDAYRTGYKIATGAVETSGTWTNATNIVLYRLSGQTADPNWIGGLTHNSGSGTTITYGAVTLQGTAAAWMLSFAGLVSATALGTRTGYNRDTSAGSAPMCVGEHVRGPAGTLQTVTATGSGAWFTAQQEILTPAITITAAPTTTATITPTAAVTKPVTAARANTATIAPTAQATKPVTASVTTTAAITATATVVKAVTATRPNTATITPTAATTKPDSASVATTTTLTATAQADKPATAAPTVTASIAPTLAATKPDTAALAPAVTATVTATVARNAQATRTTSATITAQAIVVHPSAPAIFTTRTPTRRWITARPPTTPWSTRTPTTAWTTGRPTMPQISVLSREYIEVPVTELASGLPADPTINPVFLAFLPGRIPPTDTDWLTGSWDTSAVNGEYFAKCLIGPNGGLITLTPGTYNVWLKIAASPEQPIIQTGTITAY